MFSSIKQAECGEVGEVGEVSILEINSTHASQHTRMKYFNCTHG